MKIRMGFVSNSSSSSFCIYGTYLDIDEIVTPEFIQFILDNSKNFKGKTVQDVKDYLEEEENTYEIIYELEEALGLYWDTIEGEDGVFYLGQPWKTIGDDQTGRQFKDEVEAKIKKLWPDATLDTHEEAWRG